MSDSLSCIRAALNGMRAVGPARVDVVARATIAALRRHPEQLAEWRTAIHGLLDSTCSTRLLTEAGILTDVGLLEGLLHHLGNRIAPAPMADDLGQVVASALLRPGDEVLFAALDEGVLAELVRLVLGDEDSWEDPQELADAVAVLAPRIAGHGLDHRLIERAPEGNCWRGPFIELSRAADAFAEALPRRVDLHPGRARLLAAIDACEAAINELREDKKARGTTLRLSSGSLRVQQQLDRLRLLVQATRPLGDGGARAVAHLTQHLLIALSRRRPALRFVGQKVDLVAYLVVGHAAQKGEGYAVHSARDYWRFLKKSFIGGLLVAIFACFKIHLSHEGLAPVPQGLLYGLNYAVCFALIYLFGATLATKQPALTASRLAQAIETGSDGRAFARLVRAIWRSQYVSFVGNIAGAALFALLFAQAFAALTGAPLVGSAEAAGLGAKIDPLGSASLWYAAIAGVLLSLAGFLAGFVDNAVIFHRMGDRVRQGTGLFGRLSDANRARVADRVERDLGGFSGNVALGFMLGIAGTIGYITGLPVDIRHIAFASSQGALSLGYGPAALDASTIAYMTAAVLLIGLVNFLVSFGLTLTVAVHARRLEGVALRRGFRELARLIVAEPAQFLFPVRADPPPR